MVVRESVGDDEVVERTESDDTAGRGAIPIEKVLHMLPLNETPVELRAFKFRFYRKNKGNTIKDMCSDRSMDV